MKLLIKLAITALIANAAFRIGTQYLVHYNFRDSVREAAMFQAKDDAELRERVMEIAASYDVPQTDGGFTVKRDARQAILQGTYTKKIEIVPGFPYDWKFDWDIDAYINTVPLLPGAPMPKSVKPPR